jgi:hypothetical protein
MMQVKKMEEYVHWTRVPPPPSCRKDIWSDVDIWTDADIRMDMGETSCQHSYLQQPISDKPTSVKSEPNTHRELLFDWSMYLNILCMVELGFRVMVFNAIFKNISVIK